MLKLMKYEFRKQLMSKLLLLALLLLLEVYFLYGVIAVNNNARGSFFGHLGFCGNFLCIF